MPNITPIIDRVWAQKRNYKFFTKFRNITFFIVVISVLISSIASVLHFLFILVSSHLVKCLAYIRMVKRPEVQGSNPDENKNFWKIPRITWDATLVLWCCWLGGRKGIRPLKNLSGGVLAWLSVWSEVQTCIWPSWYHCHSLSLQPGQGRKIGYWINHDEEHNDIVTRLCQTAATVQQA